MDALQANLEAPRSVSVDAAGNRYIADCDQNRVFRVDPAGVLTLFAGTGVWLGHPNGDGGPAVNAALNCPTSTAIDSAGNVYIAEQLFRVRKVDVSGVITTVAGTGDSGFSGDGGPATSAQLGYVNAVALDSAGNLYTAEGYPSHRVRRVDASTGVIVTIAGNGSNVFGGDGGLAIGASLSDPNGIAVDGAGNVYIADTEHSRVRKVAAGTGIISTVAGNGLRGFTGDGGSATSARLSVATVALAADGTLYIADTAAERVRKVSGGIITTVAGSGSTGFAGDGGPALDASMNFIDGIAVDTAGNLLIADWYNLRIRQVDAGSGVIRTVAGNGYCCFSGDGGPAVGAYLGLYSDIAVDRSGRIYIAESTNSRVRSVDATTALINTIVGDGNIDFSGDGGPAASARLHRPWGIAVDVAGNLYVSDQLNCRVRRIDAVTGLISTVAGNGNAWNDGDGGAATDASVSFPARLTVDSAGNLFVAVNGPVGPVIRRVDAATGVITTIAGNRTYGASGDGGPATSAGLDYVTALAVDAFGNLDIAQRDTVRQVDATTGVITTIVGNGVRGSGGDGGLAINASLNRPSGLVVDGGGNLYISDSYNVRVRKVDAGSGVITTVVGDGTAGFGGDGGPPLRAQLYAPAGLQIDASGNLYINDWSHVRKVTGVATPFDHTPPVIAPVVTGTLGTSGWYTSSIGIAWHVTDPESAIASETGCDAQSVSVDTPGVVFVCEATSAGGTASANVTVKRDATPPTLSFTAPAAAATYLLNAGEVAAFACADVTSGVAKCTGTSATGAALDTATVGTKMFTVDAVDNAGNSTAMTHTYHVRYAFLGFERPIDNPPVINVATAGRTIPVKWRLADANGMPVSSLSSFKALWSGPVNCESGLTDDIEEEAVGAGGTVLRVSAQTGQFIYNWATSSAWKGSCRQLVLALADGQAQAVMFRFK